MAIGLRVCLHCPFSCALLGSIFIGDVEDWAGLEISCCCVTVADAEMVSQ